MHYMYNFPHSHAGDKLCGKKIRQLVVTYEEPIHTTVPLLRDGRKMQLAYMFIAICMYFFPLHWWLHTVSA